MPNRRLTEAESKKANTLLESIRSKLQVMGAGDPELLFAIRRRVYIRLMHDERGKPAQRRKLKKLKWAQQKGLCAFCKKKLPLLRSELDRLKAVAGYTPRNTRLVHAKCHHAQQAKQGYH
jgi:hypothetical protein